MVNSTLGFLGWWYEKLPGIGKIFTQTFYPQVEGSEISAQEAFTYVPFDPVTSKNRNRYMIDSEVYWDRKNDCGDEGTSAAHGGAVLS